MNNNKTDLIVLGAGDHAKVVMATVEAQGKYTIVGLLDDDQAKPGTTVYERKVLGDPAEHLKDLRDQGVSSAIIAVGDNEARAKLTQLAVDAGFVLATVVHPTAIILKGSTVGDGSVLLANSYVGADSVLGEGVLLSVGALVAHDCEVGPWAQLCPGARIGGHVRIGDFSLIGMGAAVLPGITVGRRAVVGANAAVVEDVPDSVTVKGVPAHSAGIRPARSERKNG